MYAARNRIRLSPILLEAWAGPSLRCAVTAHLMASEPRAMCKGAAAGAYIFLAYSADAAYGLVGYLCRSGMVAMPLLHR